MPRASLAILLTAIAAAAAMNALAPGLASSATLASPVDESVWQVPGNVLHYQASVPGSTIIVAFDVLVHEVTSSLVRIDVVFLDVGDAPALQGSYDRLTREDATAPGVYVPLWIRQADVDRGSATFGDRTLTYDAAASTLQHVFADGDSRYAFHKTAGYLASIENARGGRLLLVGTSSGAALPTHVQSSPSEPLSILGPEEPVGGGGILEGEVFTLPIQTIDLECRMPQTLGPDLWPAYSIDGYAGERCDAPYYMETTTDFSYGKYRLTFPRYSVGNVQALYRDEDLEWGGGTVRHYTCAPIALIAVTEDTVVCSVEYPREFSDAYSSGHNWLETQGTWNFCLDPTTKWSCTYAWKVPATGHIACYEESDRCRTRA